MKRKSKRSVKLRTWEYFCFFAIALLIVIWLLMVMFFQYFYTDSMTRQTLRNAKEMVSLYRQGNLDEEKVKRLAYRNNLSVVITDADGEIISANDAFGTISEERIDSFHDYERAVGDVKALLRDDDDGQIYYRLENDSNRNKVLFFVAYTQEGISRGGSYIYVISQVEPITVVTVVLQKQFVIVSLITLVFALVFAYLIAVKFSRPVEKLTRSAKELALGNTDVDFSTGGEAFGEIEELSRALDYASSEITRSSVLRRELMANVSHDLRTPLTMIKMYAEMIRDLSGENKEKREKHLQIIIDETDRLTALVQDVLNLSRIEASAKEMDIKAFDLCATVQRILERFSVMEEQGYTFELDMPDRVYVLGDEQRIEQVIYNLLGNAINYTGDDKKVMVHISKRFDRAKVEIMDTGQGIPQEELANIWDRYYRSKEHIRSKVGTGLGLSIVKSILIAHNADFGIESTLGVGSDFWFELRQPENRANKTLRLSGQTDEEIPEV